MKQLTNVRRFLRLIGLGLIIAAGLGFIGFGPTPANSVTQSYLYFDRVQDLLFVLVGVVGLLTFWLSRSDRLDRVVTGVIGVMALIAAVVGIMNYALPYPNLGIINLEPVEDTILIILALWALWVAFMPDGPLFIRESENQPQTTA